VVVAHQRVLLGAAQAVMAAAVMQTLVVKARAQTELMG